MYFLNRAWAQTDSDETGAVTIFGFAGFSSLLRAQGNPGRGLKIFSTFISQQLPGDTQKKNSLSWTFQTLCTSFFELHIQNIQRKSKILAPGTCLHVPACQLDEEEGWTCVENSATSTCYFLASWIFCILRLIPMPPPLWSLHGIPSWVSSLPSYASQTLVMLASHGNFNIWVPVAGTWEWKLLEAGRDT